MNIFDLNKKLLAALLLAFMASAMLVACSSTDEAAQPEGSSCADQCAAVPDMNQDECMIACEGEI